jgi:hypothetical protein
MLLHQISQTVKGLPSFPPPHLAPGPALEGFPRSLHGKVDVFLVGGGDVCDNFFGAGVERREGFARSGIDKL